MSVKSKLINNNRNIAYSTSKLNAVKNAFLKEIPEYNGTVSNGTDTMDATATPSDVVSGKTAYVRGMKITGTHSCPSVNVETEELTVTPSTDTQTITATSGKYLSQVTVNPIPNDYIIPNGTLEVDSNGTFDVINYASVNVNVASSGDGGSSNIEYDADNNTVTIDGVVYDLILHLDTVTSVVDGTKIPALPSDITNDKKWWIFHNAKEYVAVVGIYDFGKYGSYIRPIKDGVELDDMTRCPSQKYTLPLEFTADDEWTSAGNIYSVSTSWFKDAGNTDIYVWDGYTTPTDTLYFGKTV